MSDEELANAILGILAAAQGPLDARGVLRALRALPRPVDVTRADVTRVLEDLLVSTGRALSAGEAGWRATDLVSRPAPAGPPTAGPPWRPPPEGAVASPSASRLGPDDIASLAAAVGQEIAAARRDAGPSWIEIDGIEHLSDWPGGFVYRLALASQAHFSPDQAVTFRAHGSTEEVRAVIIRSDDSGLVVECQGPLPEDARLLSMSFDPSFILRALLAFVQEMAPRAGCVARLVAAGEAPVPPSPSRPARPRQGLNEEQAQAIEDMDATPVHLLWGPPGTGKSTAVGAAVAGWARRRKRVLLVSTSNAAVDVATRAVLRALAPQECGGVLRLGTSLDPEVRAATLQGRLAATDPAAARAVVTAQARLREIKELLGRAGVTHEQTHRLHREAQSHESRIEEFNRRAQAASVEYAAGARVTACTLARMVLDAGLRETPFDVVVLDEASMASAAYALAASLLARERVVFAGDFKQLPPIVQSQGADAACWFGQSIYDWLGVVADGEVRAAGLSMLRTQYRMTHEIGGLVGGLSYGGLLCHGRGAHGPKARFIDIAPEWQTTHYSVAERSYYNLAAVPLVHALAPLLPDGEVLLLSPFRPQRSLLAALAFDLHAAGRPRVTASTIHRAQGSEARSVVVDLTAHDPQRPVAFFRDKHCENLFNVAISRARDRLVVIGSRAMLEALAGEMPFWRRVLNELGGEIEVLDSDRALTGTARHRTPVAGTVGGNGLPAIYSHGPDVGTPQPGVEALNAACAGRKLLVLPNGAGQPAAGESIVRTASGCPTVFAAGGNVCVPFRGQWLVVQSPNVSRVLWRVAFSHLADDEVCPDQARRFFCPQCPGGTLVLRRVNGEGWFLVCVGGRDHACHYRRRLSLDDARLRVRLGGMRCPQGHPLTARQGAGGYFIGCENYPHCDHTASLSVLEGT